MHCVIWTYRSAPDLTKEEADRRFLAVADRYLHVPGLMRKYFGYAEDGRSIATVDLWRSRGDADIFYTAEWLAVVSERWGVTPERSDWTVPQVVDAESGEVMRVPPPLGFRVVGPEDEDRRVKPGEGGSNDD